MSKEAFVIPRDRLEEAGLIPERPHEGAYYRPLHDNAHLDLLDDLAGKYGSFRQRGGVNDVEADETVQQLIVYAFVQRPDGKFLVYKRGGKEDIGDHRLAQKVSIGIGGHMEAMDSSIFDAFYRELDEEVSIISQGKPLDFSPAGKLDVERIKKYVEVKPVGIIKDDSNPVGRVHTGVVCRLQVNNPSLEIAIKTDSGEHTEYSYMSADEFIEGQKKGILEAETWSSIVFKNEIRPLTEKSNER